MKFVLITGLIGAVALILLSLFAATDQENREQERCDNFVIQHHCKVLPTKWYESPLWECDGFQIKHP